MVETIVSSVRLHEPVLTNLVSILNQPLIFSKPRNMGRWVYYTQTKNKLEKVLFSDSGDIPLNLLHESNAFKLWGQLCEWLDWREGLGKWCYKPMSGTEPKVPLILEGD